MKEVPVFDEVRRLIHQGVKTGNMLSNEQAAFGKIEFGPAVSREDQLLLFDPQTSGGLAIFVPEADAAGLVRALRDEGVSAVCIGAVHEGTPCITAR